MLYSLGDNLLSIKHNSQIGIFKKIKFSIFNLDEIKNNKIKEKNETLNEFQKTLKCFFDNELKNALNKFTGSNSFIYESCKLFLI